jgi:RNA polymerase sigma-70 factor (ECF subfamily)
MSKALAFLSYLAHPGDLTGCERRAPSDLVAEMLAGSARAEETLYRQVAEDQLAFATRLLSSATEADDAFHDAWIAARTNLSKLERTAAFVPWLRKIVLNECRKRLRRRRRFQWFSGDEDSDRFFDLFASGVPSPDDLVTLRRLHQRITTLSTDERIVWCLRFVEGYSPEEGATLLGCSVSTYKRRLRRAVARVGSFVLEVP